MKRVKVEVPFRLIAAGKDLVPGDVIDVDGDTLSRIRAANVNMVTILGDVEPEPEAKSAKKAEAKTGK